MTDKVKEIEVRACCDRMDDGVRHARWVPEADADYFSVYGGGPGNFGWLADFIDKLDACYWGRERAMRLGVPFVNRIGVV